MFEKDWYTILGINPDASQAEIRDAYIKISRVIHPDRFNAEKQPIEWQQANEMLKDVNNAYDTLSDPTKRALYDEKKINSNYRKQQPQNSPPKPTTSNSSNSSEIFSKSQTSANGKSLFHILPNNIKKQLIDRQENRISEQYYVQTHRVGWKFFWIIILSSWFLFLFALAGDYRWSDASMYWYTAISVCVTLLIGYNIDWIWRWKKSNLKCRLYVTPLYLIQTHFDEVNWWQLWKIRDINITHNYRNGWYQNTIIQLTFPEEVHNFLIYSKENAEQFLEALKRFERRLRLEASYKNWDYFIENDDFRGISSYKSTKPFIDNIRYMSFGSSLITGIIVVYFASIINADKPSLTGIPQKSEQSITSDLQSYSPSQNAPVEIPQQRIPFRRFGESISSQYPNSHQNNYQQFNEPIQPLPENGIVKRYNGEEPLAPLEIKTRGDGQHYYIKVSDWITGQTIITIFIRGGYTAEALVPLGTYRIKYATGKDWYGETFLFGLQTSYSEVNEEFHFYDNEDEYIGYTVELFTQQDGNLSTRRITPNQW